MAKIKFIDEEIKQIKMDKLTIKELYIIQAACDDFASNLSDYLLSEVGSTLPEDDRVAMVKKINLCRNSVMPKIEEMIKIEEKNDLID